MEFDTKTRDKRIMVWVSKEEKALIDAKAEHYGYKQLAKYIRDSAIYEKVTKYDIKNKNEILKAFSDNTKELRKIAKEFRHISKYATLVSNDDLDNITMMIVNVLKSQKSMLNLINEKLDLEVWKEIEHLNFDKEKEREELCRLRKE